MSRKVNLMAGFIVLFYVVNFWGIYSASSPLIKLIGLLPILALAFVQLRLSPQLAIPTTMQTILYFAVAIYPALLLFVAPLPQYSIESVLFGVLLFLVFAFMGIVFRNRDAVLGWEDSLLAAFTLFILIEMIVVPFHYMQWWKINGEFLSPPPVGLRLSGALLGGPNHVSALANLILPIGLVRAMRTTGWTKRLWWIVAGLLFLGVQYYSSSRAGWLSGIAAVFITLALYFNEAIRKAVFDPSITFEIFKAGPSKKILALCGIIASMLLAVLFVRQSQNSPGHNGLLSGRPAIWSSAAKVWSQSVVFGNGLDSFPVYYALQIHAPPGWIPNQAHNLLLQIGAETGLVGVLLVTALVGLAFQAFLRAWRSSKNDVEQRTRLSSYAGAGVAVFVHGGADYLFDNGLYALTATILLALVFAHEPLRKESRQSRLILVVITTISFVFYVVWAWSVQSGYESFKSGLMEWDQANWRGGAEQICAAADRNPEQSYYHFQCAMGLTYVATAEEDPSLFTDSVRSYGDGFQRDQLWPLDFANLASIYWQAGNQKEALDYSQRALDSTPMNAMFLFNQALMYEELGEIDKAREDMVAAVQNDPWIAISPYLLDKDLADEMLELIDQSKVEESELVKLRTYLALRSGDIQEAAEEILQVEAGTEADAEILVLLALISQKQGELDNAWRWAQTAVFLDGETPRILSWAAEVAAQQGKTEYVRAWRARAFDNWAQKLTFSKDFYVGVYHRGSLPFDLVPGFLRPDATEEMVSGFTWLAADYRRAGNPLEADQIDLWLRASGLN